MICGAGPLREFACSVWQGGAVVQQGLKLAVKQESNQTRAQTLNTDSSQEGGLSCSIVENQNVCLKVLMPEVFALQNTNVGD